jgi:PTS system cellobiose-specific IIC component
VPSEELPAKQHEFIDRVVARLRAFAESPEMVAIRRALPISFVGLFIGLGYFMATQPAPTLLLRFSHSFAAGFGVMSALLVLVLSVMLARARNVSVVACAAIALAAFAFSLPYQHADSFAAIMKALGSSGLFLAIGIAVITVDALAAASRKFGRVAGTLVSGSLVVGVAALLMALGISLTHGLNVAIAPLGDLGDSLTALLIITLVETLLWTIGIHGPALLAPVVLPVYINLQVQNTEAFAHNQPLPHIVTVSMFLFVFPGGAGGTFSLVLLLLRTRVKRLRTVALATLLPSFANANEPLMFGLPLVLNPILGIPFVIVPLVLSIVSWWAMNLNLVARPVIYIPSTIPLPIGGFLATKDWRSIVLTLLDVAIAAGIYAPFVRIYERQEMAKQELIEEPA